MERTITATNTDDFEVINELIHDQFFDMDDITRNVESGIVEIPYCVAADDQAELIKDWWLYRKYRVPLYRYLLRIYGVSSCQIHDDDGTRESAFNIIEYDALSGMLSIDMIIPFTLKLWVSSIHIVVVTSDDVIGMCPMTWFLGGFALPNPLRYIVKADAADEQSS